LAVGYSLWCSYLLLIDRQQADDHENTGSYDGDCLLILTVQHLAAICCCCCLVLLLVLLLLMAQTLRSTVPD